MGQAEAAESAPPEAAQLLQESSACFFPVENGCPAGASLSSRSFQNRRLGAQSCLSPELYGGSVDDGSQDVAAGQDSA